jgi:hypothetical protein
VLPLKIVVLSAIDDNLKSVVEVIPRVDTPTTIFGVPERPKEVVAKLAD